MLHGWLAEEAARLDIYASYEDSYRRNGTILSMDVHVVGLQHLVERWVSMLKRSLQQCSEAGDKLRVIRDFMLRNNRLLGAPPSGPDGAVYLEPPYFGRKAWFATFGLSAQRVNVLTGQQGAAILDETNRKHRCMAELILENTGLPHISILGDCPIDVRSCRSFVSSKLAKPKKFRDASKRK